MNKQVLRSLSYGVYVVTSKDGARDVGCVANCAMQVSSRPATIAISINHDNFTNGAIAKSGVFALSILPENIDRTVIGTFGFSSSRDTDKFASVPSVEADGVRVLSDAVGYAVCKVIDTMETVSHTVFLGEVISAEMLGEGVPMSYAYYHNVIKGKSPKNAPTYVEEEAPKNDVAWKCTVCGYVANMPELPDDYTCPICTVPKSLFNKI